MDNNTKRLNKSIESLNNGDTVTKTLEELGIEEDDEFLGFYEDDWWGDEPIREGWSEAFEKYSQEVDDELLLKDI